MKMKMMIVLINIRLSYRNEQSWLRVFYFLVKIFYFNNVDHEIFQGAANQYNEFLFMYNTISVLQYPAHLAKL